MMSVHPYRAEVLHELLEQASEKMAEVLLEVVPPGMEFPREAIRAEIKKVFRPLTEAKEKVFWDFLMRATTKLMLEAAKKGVLEEMEKRKERGEGDGKIRRI